MVSPVRQLTQSLGRLISHSSTALLDFVYPPDCELCGASLPSGQSAFCEKCLGELKPRMKDECPRCGAPVGLFVDLQDGCGQCRSESFAFDRVIRLGIYDGLMRKACLRAKSNHGRIMAMGLASALAREKTPDFAEWKFSFVAPIPEHWTRTILHSHYAAESISSELARHLGVSFHRHLLRKKRRTPKQATSPTAQRRSQQKGSFRATSSTKLKDATVLLVDDILTTGSTAHAAAAELKRAGAKHVVVAVLAVSPLKK